tara:strand:- start:620 stop:1036 length:417 start_codon:yes stop_codon:yes gene_type:complete
VYRYGASKIVSRRLSNDVVNVVGWISRLFYIMVDIRLIFLGILTLCVSTMVLGLTPVEPPNRTTVFPEVCWYVVSTSTSEEGLTVIDRVEKKCKDMNPFLPLDTPLEEDLDFKFIVSAKEQIKNNFKKSNCDYEVITC